MMPATRELLTFHLGNSDVDAATAAAAAVGNRIKRRGGGFTGAHFPPLGFYAIWAGVTHETIDYKEVERAALLFRFVSFLCASRLDMPPFLDPQPTTHYY